MSVANVKGMPITIETWRFRYLSVGRSNLRLANTETRVAVEHLAYLGKRLIDKPQLEAENDY